MSNSAPPNDIETLHRLTEAQLGILYQCIFSEDQPSYQNQIRYSITGEFDPSILERSVNDVIARHEPLRTVYLHKGLEQPAAVVKRSADIPFERLDLSALNAKEQQNELARISSKNINSKITLNKAPLIRFSCIQLASKEFHLIIDFHHIIYDGWSNSIFLSEIQAFYVAHLHQTKPELPPSSKFSNFIATQSQSSDDYGLSFWENKLAGVSAPTPLPLDKQKPGHAIANAQHEHHLSQQDAFKLKKCARANRITINALIVSAWAYTISRYTNSDDIIFGMALNGRSRVMDAHERTIGLFVNTLPLRLRCESSMALGAWLQYVQKELIGINQYDQTPLSAIHKLSDVKPGVELFESLIAFQDFPSTDNAEDISSKIPWQYSDTIIHENSPLPLTLEVFDAESISFLAMYSDLRLDRKSVEQIVRHLCNTLRSFADLNGANQRVADVRMLGAHEREQECQHYLQYANNATDKQYLNEHVTTPNQHDRNSIFDLFEQQVAKNPTSIAVKDDTLSLTYLQLSLRVDALEQYLTQIGVKSGDRVAICTGRNADMYPALLALIKINAPFVPVDTAWPAKRVRQITEDCEATLVLADPANVKVQNALSIPVMLIDGSSPVSVMPGVTASHPSRSTAFNSDHLYVMYTSGSSGKPKGVIGTQSSTLNRFNWMWQQYPFNGHDLCVQKAPLCFVDSVWELFGALLKGVTTHIASDEKVQTPHAFADTLQQHRATRLVIVPSLLSVLLESVENISEKLFELRLCTVSGEFLPVALANLFNKLLPDCTLLNLYGSTEVAADTCWIEIDPSISYQSGQIGNPISGCATHVLNKDLKPMPPGAIGELCISGLGVSAGYIDSGCSDTVASVDSPFTGNPFADGLLYKTGDLASRGIDGSLTLHGRTDSRHKLNGMRVDLQEITGVIMEHPQIDLAITQIAHNGQLISWYQSQIAESLDSATIRDFLVDHLPDWMVPQKLLQMQSLPRLSSGKIDSETLLKTLKEPQTQTPESDALLTKNEKALAKLWQEILPECKLTRDSVFVETGGDSLSAMRLNAAVQRTFKTNIPPRMLLVANLKQLASSFDVDNTDQHERSDPEKQDSNSDSSVETSKTDRLNETTSGKPVALEPIMFPAQGQTLYGVIHHPQQDSKDTAVLMCSSIAHEYMKVHSLYQSIAMNLSKQGYCVMRFDYTGFGNSSGEPGTANIDNWRNDIIQAAARLRKTSKKTKLTMVVCRLGLPLLLSAFDCKTTRIVALDPVYNGRAYTDHLAKLHQFALVNTDRYRHAQTKSHPFERFGYLYSENLLSEISSLQVDPSELDQNIEVSILQTGNPSDIDGSGRHNIYYSDFNGSAESTVTINTFSGLHIWSDYDTAQALILHQSLAEHIAQLVSHGEDRLGSG